MARLPTLQIPVGIDDDADEPEASGALIWLGTSTVLLRYLGITILTDPCFLRRGRRVRHHLGARMVKLRDPAMKAEALPTIDLVVLTHFHPAHFDVVGARQLDAAVPIVTTTHGAAQLRRLGYVGARGLTSWDELAIEKGAARLLVTATPASHGRGAVRALFPPGMGAILDFESPEQTRFRLWISGDACWSPALAEIARRFPDVDLAVLHLGGERVAGSLVTMDGEQGAEAIEALAPHRAIPVHYDDWSVFSSPIDDFRDALARRGLTRRVRLLARGETYRFGAVSRTSLPPNRLSQVPRRVPSRP